VQQPSRRRLATLDLTRNKLHRNVDSNACSESLTMCTIFNVLIHLVLGTSFTDDSFAGNLPAAAAACYCSSIPHNYAVISTSQPSFVNSIYFPAAIIIMHRYGLYKSSYSMLAALLCSRIKTNFFTVSCPPRSVSSHLQKEKDMKK